MLSDHAHAWGKSMSTINKIDMRTLADATLTASRKERHMLVNLFSLVEQKESKYILLLITTSDGEGFIILNHLIRRIFEMNT